MKYFVSNNKDILYEQTHYAVISEDEAIKILMPEPILGLDTETTGFDPFTKKLLSVQLGTFDFQVFIDVHHCDFKKFIPLLEDKNKLFIIQNAKFDLKFLYRYKIVIHNVFDTFLAERLMYLGYPHSFRSASLKSITQNYLGIELDKSPRDLMVFAQITDQIIIYGCNDVKYLIPIYEKQLIALKHKGLTRAIQIENEFVKVLAYVEFCGIQLDVLKWSKRLQSNQKELRVKQDHLNRWVVDNLPESQFVSQNLQGDLFTGFDTSNYCNINWDSPKQVVEFFKFLKFDLIVKDPKTEQYRYSVDASVLIPQRHLSPVVDIYLDYKDLAKNVSTYGQNFIDAINPITKRIHTQFTQLLVTGRLSSGGENRDTGESYLNLQNIPANEETRSCFIPTKGYKYIDCDYTAQEDLVFTELSQESKLIEFYNDTTRKRDGHSFVAKLCFPKELKDIPEEDVKTKFPKLRAIAKTAKFAIHYGGCGMTIAGNLNIPKDEGKRIETAYLNAFPDINKYSKKVKSQMWDRGYILISELTGHKRYIYNYDKLVQLKNTRDPSFWAMFREMQQHNPKHDQVLKIKELRKRINSCERAALNAPVQGTSALITKLAGILYFKHLIEKNLLFTVLIPNLIHDEILIEVPESIVEEEAKILQKAMEDAGKVFCKSVTLKAEPIISESWIH